MGEQLGLFNRFTSLTISEAIPIYWELEGRFLRGKGHRSAIKQVNQHLGGLYLHKITGPDVANFRQCRQMDGVKDSTINKEHGRITRLFNAFREWKTAGTVGGYDFTDLQLPALNPGEQIPLADETKYRRNLVVTPEMFYRFCDYAHPRVRRICTIAILTLLRRKDIRLLRSESLNTALEYLSGVQSKTGKPFNVHAPLSVRVIFNQAKEEEKDYICDFTNFRRYFERARVESGVYFQFKDLRRSGATQLLLAGIDIRTIQRLLGHQTLTMTETYLAPPPTATKEAGKKLEELYAHSTKIPDYAFDPN